MQNRKNCYICSSEKVSLKKEVNRLAVNKCNSCGLLWVTGVDKDEVASYYNQSYFNNELTAKDGYHNYSLNEANHRMNARKIIRAVNRIKDLRKARVLDIRCAFGFLLDELRRQKGCEAHGVELSRYAYEYALNRLGLNMINAEFESGRHFETDFFDAVFLIGTIEHLLSPRQTLGNIGRILKKEGLLVVTTIDTRGLFPLYSIKPPEHTFYFNHRNISLLMEQENFRVVFKKTYFANYYLGDLIRRLINFFSLPLLDNFHRVSKNRCFNISMKIPTNEMIVIAQKTGD